MDACSANGIISDDGEMLELQAILTGILVLGAEEVRLRMYLSSSKSIFTWFG
jgi:hypothetical protein